MTQTKTNAESAISAATANNRQWNTAVIDQIVQSLKDKPGALLPILHAIQGELGYIPEDVKPVLAKELHLSTAEVHGVVSFYPYFRSKAPGRHKIEICRAESCQAMGSRALESHIKQTLGVDYHETTADGEFSLEAVYCLGNCACSPAIRVDDDIIGNVSNPVFDALVSELTTQVVEVK